MKISSTTDIGAHRIDIVFKDKTERTTFVPQIENILGRLGELGTWFTFTETPTHAMHIHFSTSQRLDHALGHIRAFDDNESAANEVFGRRNPSAHAPKRLNLGTSITRPSQPQAPNSPQC